MNRKNDHIILFGSTGSIGIAITKELLSLNYKLIGINRKKVNKKKSLENLIYYQCNLLNNEEILRTCTLIKEKFKVKGLIFSSGINSNQITGNTIEKMNSLYQVNTIAPLIIIEALSKQLIKNKASVVLIGSVGAYLPMKDISYAASKAALISISKSLAWKYGEKGVRINVVNPGPTISNMISHWKKSEVENRIKRTALKKLAKPKEIASVVSFLLSSKASHITGISIDVSGGFGMK